MMKKNAFTLIELLVVVAIIGVLAMSIYLSLTILRQKARDATRKSDLDKIKKALQLYHADTGTYPASIYPDIKSTATNYLKRTPVDPRSDIPQPANQYFYITKNDPSTSTINDFAIASIIEFSKTRSLLGLATPTPGGGSGVFECTSNCPGVNGYAGKSYQVSSD